MHRSRAGLILGVLFMTGAIAWWTIRTPQRAGNGPESEGGGPYPSDWFGAQRAFPSGTIPQEAYRAAVEQLRVERALAKAAAPGTDGGLVWQNAGPFNIGGRVTALAVAPGGNTVYLGAANGGVFKSTNAGVNWTPIFDDLAVFSIGALALHPNNPNTLYVGTGEANSAVDNYDGAGLFRTTDGGTNWQLLGLESTRRIARVAVDPNAPNRIFVAAMGAQFSTDNERGLYRSTDSGASWTKVLFVNDSTGVCDVIVHPTFGDTVFAATWERVRRPAYRRAYGPGCGIWRSVNGGTTWARLANGLPAPSDSVGRIGLCFAKSRPRTVYAHIISGAELGYQGLGLYRTTNGGDTWTRRDSGTSFTSMFGGFGWYFGDVVVDPTDAEKVYVLGVSIKRSPTGGTTYTTITNGAHVDMHALWVDPANPSRLYLGNDGGFYSSTDAGSSWSKSLDLPITQFYAGTVDPSDSRRLLGGTQDNNTLLTTGSPSGWDPILGGDGFYCLVDPLDPNVILAEWQNCCGRSGPRRSIDGGQSWGTPSGFDPSDRYNWNTPFAMDPNNHDVVLVGGHRVYKSTDNGENYVPVSGDLSGNPPASLMYGTITTLDISPVNSAVYYAGTDDGRVWRSTDSGNNWVNISTGLPVRWVTRVTADRFAASDVYVTLSGFTRDEPFVHVYRSTNQGGTWTPIASNLPDVPANDILVDPTDRYTLYLATDAGVWATRNRGASWFPLGDGMPVQTIFDLSLHAASRTLVAATHGRGQWTLDLTGLPTDVAATNSTDQLRLGAPSPNPSRGPVRFALTHQEAAGALDVALYDVSGRRLRTLHRGVANAGATSIEWDGRDARGDQVAAGVYFVRAATGSAVRMQRVVRVE